MTSVVGRFGRLFGAIRRSLGHREAETESPIFILQPQEWGIQPSEPSDDRCQLTTSPMATAPGFHYQEHALGGSFGDHVASDSALTVRCGNRQYARRANGSLWVAIEWFERHGYRLRWHHVARATSPWNRLADEVAGPARRAVAGINGPKGDLP